MVTRDGKDVVNVLIGRYVSACRCHNTHRAHIALLALHRVTGTFTNWNHEKDGGRFA